ncbi:MAG: SAP domain-containing protein [Spirochaetaceae bacterium]|nr:SAP domain-containing protein [Spirochaetaceae bacterium]
MSRPPFSEIKSFSEFSKYYWYREELKQICKQLGIDSNGMKAELNRNIEEYFKGNLIRPKSKTPVKARANTAVSCASRAQSAADDVLLTLDTPLLACNFRFSQRFRDFFSTQTGIARFKFNTDMVATAKKVRETGDTSFTLGDLLDIFYGKKTYAKYDNSCLQWNKFVKDFCADPQAAQFSDKLKTAAILWSEVRN